MTRLGLLAVAAAGIIPLSTGLMGCKADGRTSSSEIVMFPPESDAELLQAEAEARRTLPMFWRMLEQYPKYGSAFSVKARFEGQQGYPDYLWLVDLKREGNQVTGVLYNEPDAIPNLHLGAKVQVSEDRIVDWLIYGEHGQFGHFTMRILMKRDPKAAAKANLKLSPDPLPPAFRMSDGK